MKITNDNSANTNTDLESVFSTVEKGSINKGKCIMKTKNEIVKIAVREARVVIGLAKGEIRGVKEIAGKVKDASKSVAQQEYLIKEIWKQAKVQMMREYLQGVDKPTVKLLKADEVAKKEYSRVNKIISRVKEELGLKDKANKKEVDMVQKSIDTLYKLLEAEEMQIANEKQLKEISDYLKRVAKINRK